MAEQTVTIPVSHLTELEKTIADLQARLAKRTHHNLESLRAYDAANPEKAKERKQRYNERRSELRRQKREARKLETDASASREESPGPK
jgi:hypothetical protein